MVNPLCCILKTNTLYMKYIKIKESTSIKIKQNKIIIKYLHNAAHTELKKLNLCLLFFERVYSQKILII